MTTTLTAPADSITAATECRENTSAASLSHIGQRMVRELELFLSYALASGTQRRWIGIVSGPAANRVDLR